VGGGWLRIERKDGRRGGWLGWRCPLIVEIMEVFPVGGVARGVFLQFSRFLSFFLSFSLFLVFFPPFPPFTTWTLIYILTSFFCSTDIKNDKAC